MRLRRPSPRTCERLCWVGAWLYFGFAVGKATFGHWWYALAFAGYSVGFGVLWWRFRQTRKRQEALLAYVPPLVAPASLGISIGTSIHAFNALVAESSSGFPREADG